MLAKGDGLLERLRRGSSAAASTLETVRSVLPADLASHVWGAGVRGATLTVLVDSGAWATRIRYHAPTLKDGVAARLGITLERAVVRVRPAGQETAAAST